MRKKSKPPMVMFFFLIVYESLTLCVPKTDLASSAYVCLSFHLSLSLPDPADHKNTRTLLEADTFPSKQINATVKPNE